LLHVESSQVRDIIIVGFASGFASAPAAFRGAIGAFLQLYLGTPDAPTPFGGRKRELEFLDTWLRDPTAPGALLLTAPAGRGKSSLLVHWIATLPADAFEVVFVPISIRFQTSHKRIFYQALAARLGAISGAPADQPAVLPADPDLYRERVQAFFQEYRPGDKTVLVVIDGLDEATGWEPGWGLFPMQPQPGIKIVVSAREQVDDRGAAGWRRRLGWPQHPAGAVRTLDLALLDVGGVRDVLEGMGCPLTDLAGDVNIVKALHSLSEGDPLLLALYIEDLSAKGEAAAQLRPQDLLEPSRLPGFGPYFLNWLDDQRKVWHAEGNKYDEHSGRSSTPTLPTSSGGSSAWKSPPRTSWILYGVSYSATATNRVMS
jgi:hypothetical protein